jgi:hypothetical protein
LAFYRSSVGDLERRAVESPHFSYPQVADLCLSSPVAALI